ncbi:solute carrier family 26 member 6-like, partial [Actinia tenebrosa]|uniref:Solute carrier family 26 member 6-like n=1 Tax=Actinia tenebrosa TaxID=6105 RepID=A0A6P8HVT9_ACTTE
MGLGCGVLCAVLMVVLPSSSPKYSILGHVRGTDIFKDIIAYPHACELQGIKILRFESSLYYVNTEYFKSLVQSITSVGSSFERRDHEKKKEYDKLNGNVVNCRSKVLMEQEDCSSDE